MDLTGYPVPVTEHTVRANGIDIWYLEAGDIYEAATGRGWAMHSYTAVPGPPRREVWPRSEYAGQYASPNFPLVLLANAAWLVFPLIIIGRMWRSPSPFTRAVVPAPAHAPSWMEDTTEAGQ
jgi:hypothetical protein